MGSPYPKSVAHYPHLLKEWHPTKNRSLKPSDFSFGSNKKVWWLCNQGHEWQAVINLRSRGTGCPYCSGRKATKDNSLEALMPDLAEQWHPGNNGKLSPSDVKPGSEKKVWWKCARGHEWAARVANRSNGTGCPFCSGKKVGADNNLNALFPQLAAEWHPSRNGDLGPSDVSPGSSKRVWWRCSYGHEWTTSINNRTKGTGCPYCSGRSASDDNNLAAKRPDLAREWHPTKNGDLAPTGVVPGSVRKVWWLCKYGHEWKAAVYARARGSGCPYCAGYVERPRYSDNIETLFPKLAYEWHPTKNGSLTPQDLTPGSIKKVWWVCEHGHEWQALVGNRIRGNGCPYCSNKLVNEDNCLEARYPYLAAEWHPTKNKELTPGGFVSGSGTKVWWKCSRGHEWKARINSRVRGTGCPKCSPQTSRLEIRVFCELRALFDDVIWHKKIQGAEFDIYLPKYNVGIEVDGFLWHEKRTRWDNKKAGILQSSGGHLYRLREHGLKAVSERDIILGHGEKENSAVKRLLAKLLQNEPLDGEHMLRGNEYLKTGEFVNDSEYRRMLSLLPSPPHDSSLETLHPRLAREWNFSKNSPLAPGMFLPGSGKKVWWKCKLGHEWKAQIASRAAGCGCPYCTNQKTGSDNSLAALRPDLAQEWHATKNGLRLPSEFTPGSHEKVWWKCPQGHEWKAAIRDRVRWPGCPFCSGKRVASDNHLAAVLPDVAREWHPTRNGTLSPCDVRPGSGKRVWWKCRYGHEWQTVIAERKKGHGCPYCAGKKVGADNNLAVMMPGIAKE